MAETVDAGVRFIASDEGVSDTVSQMGTHFTRTTDKMRQTIKQTGYLRLALTRIATYTAIFTFFGALTKLIGEAISLQTRLAEVSTLVDMRNRDMAESFRVVTRDLLNLSPYLGTATDLTKGLYEIMSAGVSKPVEAFKLLVVAAKYAKAGITDLATAASSLTAIMKAYGYAADEMRAKSDMLFASVMEGKYHAEELNAAIGKVLPTAAAMGVQIDEVVAALAVLTQRGLDVSEAATGLNRMFLALLRPMDKAKKILDKLGIAYGRNAFIGKGLVGVLRQIIHAEKRHGDILPQIFRRQRSLRVSFVLAGEGFKDYVVLLQKVNDATEGSGEVSRGYGKMIGTVAEEVKAAGAKMLAVMYDLWKGKGFEWLGGLIRLLSSSIAVVLKSSVVWSASIPIIFGVVKAYRRAAWTMGMWKANMDAFYASTGKMTKALYAQGLAFQQMTAKATKLAAILRTLKVSLIAGIVFYVAAKVALDLWTASIEKAIGVIHRKSRAMTALRDELKMYTAAARAAGEATENINKELHNLGKADVLEALRRSTKDLKLFHKISMTVEEGFRKNSPAVEHLDEDVNNFLDALRRGQKDMTEFNWIIEILAKSWGYSAKRIKEWMDAQKLNLAVVREHIEGLKFLTRLQRDWNKIVESSSKHVENLAKELSKEELADGIKLLREMMTLKEGTPKYEQAKKYLLSLGIALDVLTKEKLPEYLAKWEEAQRQQPRVFKKMEFDEMMRELLAVFEKIYPPLDTLENKVLSLGEIWKTKWAKNLGDSAKTMQLFVDKNRVALELVAANWERLGEVEYKVLVEKMIEMLTKGLSAQQKAARKAKTIHESLVNDFTRIDSTMQQMRNELRDEEYNDILSQTKRTIILQRAKLEKWLELEIASGKSVLAVWAEYHRRRLEFLEFQELAEQVARKRWLQAQIDENKQILSRDYEFSWQRVKAAQEMYKQMEADVKNMTNISKEELAQRMADLDTFKAYIEKLLADMTPYTRWIESLKYLQKMFRALSTQLKSFAEEMGITSGAVIRIIKVLDALSNGFGAIVAGLQMVEFAASAMITGIAATFMTFLGWLAVILAVITLVVNVLSSIFGSKQQTDAERMAESVARVRTEFAHYGRITEGVAKQYIELKLRMGEMRAELSVLTQVMRDAGVNTKNFTEYLGFLMDVLNDIARSQVIREITRDIDRMGESADRAGGRLDRGMGRGRRGRQGGFQDWDTTDIEEMVLDLGAAFAELVENAERLGLEGSAELTAFILKVRELGLRIKEVDEYTIDWLTKGAEGLTKMIWAAEHTEEEFQRLANIALATFNGMIASGMTLTEALAVMEESLVMLKLRMESLGIEGGAAIDSLLEIALVRRLYSDLFEAIEGNLMVLNALGNSASLYGEVGAQAFADIAAQAQAYYDRLIAAGLTEQQALAVMVPTLQRLQYYAEQYGLEIDANTQRLIDQADAYGLLEGAGQTVAEILTTGFEGVIAAIHDLISVLTGSNGLDGAFGTWNRNFSPGNGGVRGGSYVGAPSGGFTPVGVPESGDLVAVIEIDGQRFYKAVVPYFRKGVRYGEFDEGDY